MGRPKAALNLTEDERQTLERFARRAVANRQLAFRARLILKSDSGKTHQEIKRELRTTQQTIVKWRKRFLADRVEGLHDEPKPGRPREISDERIEALVVKTLETTPQGKTHWSTRGMAREIGLSHATVGRIWRTFGLKPHSTEGYKLSDDPYFVEKVRDIVGLYMSPPDNAVVLSVDEKSQIQALARATPVLPMDLGQPERRTHNYVRHGTTDLFAALDVATGQVLGRCFGRHRTVEFVEFLKHIDVAVAKDREVHVILDNLATHKTAPVKRWLLRHPRFHLHFTPTHSSWLNMVERFFSTLTTQALRRGSHTSVPQLRKAIEGFIDQHNESSRPFRWTKSADDILAKVERFATRTLRAHPARIRQGIMDPGY